MAAYPHSLGACASAIAALASLHAPHQTSITVELDPPAPYQTALHVAGHLLKKTPKLYKWHLPPLPRDQWIVAASGWCEGRGGGAHLIQGTINVLANRAKLNGDTIAQEALKAAQISCWNPGTGARSTMYGIGRWIDPHSPDGIAWVIARGMAVRQAHGDLPDITHHALWYHTATCHPKWDRDVRQVAAIGAHRYFVKKGARA